MPNALAAERSPYLRAHASNPVDWLPYGAQALALAAERDLPLLISIGYSACHWCHVMERESFSDPEVAALMNAHFVCVKVDREERPDLDAIYMDAIQSLSGHGGWPLNVFCTPTGAPFFAGTYYPPQRRGAMPSWPEVLRAISSSWRQERDELESLAARLAQALCASARLQGSQAGLDESLLAGAQARIERAFDSEHGGFGTGAKFPQPCLLELLLARSAVQGPHSQAAAMVTATLDAMAHGGIHDLLGGGFHRYAVDRAWRIPHFEKMLYDNALLARLYARAYLQLGRERYAEVAHTTLRWALAEMRGPEGCFYSSIDADVQGQEGGYYLWQASELQALLGAHAQGACAWLGVSAEGNFADPHGEQRGQNVLIAAGGRPEPKLEREIRSRLAAAREERERPALDQKRIASWNGLMIAALSECSQILREPSYLQAAEAAAEHILAAMRAPDGSLMRTYIDGHSSGPGFLEDHAHLLEGLIALFEAGCQERWLHAAQEIAAVMIARFHDPEHGGFFTAQAQQRQLAARKDIEDNPTPSGNASAALGLLRLSQLCDHEQAAEIALGTLALLREPAERFPLAFSYGLLAIQRALSPPAPLACALPAAPARAGHRA